MRLLITGATGYVGSTLVRHALAHGHEVTVASRTPLKGFSGNYLHYDLSDEAALEIPDGCAAVLHLAASTSSMAGISGKQEVAAARSLIGAASAAGARFIFVSSQVASLTAPTAYGRIKAEIETETLAAGGTVVRLGQVYGGARCGLFGQHVETVRKLPLLPAFKPSPVFQLIHAGDAAEGVLRAAECNNRASRVYHLAHAAPVPFTAFLDGLARDYRPRPALFLPVPALPIRFACRLFPAKSSPRRLLSLFDLKLMPVQKDLDDLQLKPRPFKPRSRRALAREGQCLFHYLGKGRAGRGLLARYVRAIEKLSEGEALPLRKVFIYFPRFLALIDSPLAVPLDRRTAFAWRLDAATRLLEATPSGSKLFLGPPRGRFHAIGKIIGAGVRESLWLAASLGARPFNLYDERRAR